MNNEQKELTKLAAALRSMGHDKYAQVIEMAMGAGGVYSAVPASTALAAPTTTALALSGGGAGGGGTGLVTVLAGGGGSAAMGSKVLAAGPYAVIAAGIAVTAWSIFEGFNAYSEQKKADAYANIAMAKSAINRAWLKSVKRRKKDHGEDPQQGQLARDFGAMRLWNKLGKDGQMESAKLVDPLRRISKEDWAASRIQLSEGKRGVSMMESVLTLGYSHNTAYGSKGGAGLVLRKMVGEIRDGALTNAELKAQFDEIVKKEAERLAKKDPTPDPGVNPSPNIQPSGPWGWGTTAVEEVQTALNEKFNTGLVIDGKWGKNSEDAWSSNIAEARPGTEAEALLMIEGAAPDADQAVGESGPLAAETEVSKEDFIEYLTQNWEDNPKTNRDKDTSLLENKHGDSISEHLAEQMYNKANWNNHVSALYRKDNDDKGLEDLGSKEEADPHQEALSTDDYFNPNNTNIWMRKSDGALFWAPKGDVGKLMPLNLRNRGTGSDKFGYMTYAEGNSMKRLLKKHVADGTLTDAQRDGYIKLYRAHRNEARKGGATGEKRREDGAQMIASQS